MKSQKLLNALGKDAILEIAKLRCDHWTAERSLVKQGQTKTGQEEKMHVNCKKKNKKKK